MKKYFLLLLLWIVTSDANAIQITMPTEVTILALSNSVSTRVSLKVGDVEKFYSHKIFIKQVPLEKYEPIKSFNELLKTAKIDSNRKIDTIDCRWKIEIKCEDKVEAFYFDGNHEEMVFENKVYVLPDKKRRDAFFDSFDRVVGN